MSAAELAEQIRTYGTWDGPNDILDALAARAETAEQALREIALHADPDSIESGIARAALARIQP